MQKTEKHANQLLHSGAGDLTADNRVPHSDVGDSSESRRGTAFKEKDRPMISSRVDSHLEAEKTIVMYAGRVMLQDATESTRSE